MAKDLSGGVLTEMEAPSIGSATGGYAAPAKPSAFASIASAVVELAPLGMALYKKSQTDDLQADLSSKLLKISEARTQGANPAEVETRYRQTIAEYKQRNPQYLDEINAISMKTIGRNPVAEGEQASRDVVLQAQKLGEVKNFGLGSSEEKNISDGMNIMNITSAAESRAKALTAGNAGNELIRNNLLGAAFKLGDEASGQVQGITSTLVEASSMANTPEGAIQVNQALSNLTQVATTSKRLEYEAMMRIAVKEHPGVDLSKLSADLKTQIDTRWAGTLDAVKYAQENGYMKTMSDKLKMLTDSTGVSIHELAPKLSAAMKILGPRATDLLFTTESLRNSAQLFQGEMANVLSAFSSVDAESPTDTRSRLDNVLGILGGKYVVDDLKDPTGRSKVLGDLGKVLNDVVSNPNTVGTHREQAGLNAMGNLFGVASSINVTTENNISKVTSFVTPESVKMLQNAKDQDKADRVADTVVNTLYKERQIILKEAVGDGKLIEFNKDTGKYQLQMVPIAEVYGNRNRNTGISITSKAVDGKVWTAANLQRDQKTYQGYVDKLNANVEKQWMLSQYSPAMQKAKNPIRWAEVLHQTDVSNVPYVKGQTPSTGLADIIQKSTPEIDQRKSKLGMVLAPAVTALAQIASDQATGMYLNKDAKVAAIKAGQAAAEEQRRVLSYQAPEE
jgi:hypothetical protein